MENKNQTILKKYLFHLLGILLFSYGLMILTAEDMKIIEVEWEFHLSMAYIGVYLAYKYNIILLKEGRKNIFYSLFVILSVFLMHYWFCLKNDCLYIEDIYKFFLVFYIIIFYEIFDFVFYKEIVDEGKKEIVSRILKLNVPKKYNNNALSYFAEILKIKHLYHIDDLKKENHIDDFMEKEEGWLFYQIENKDLEFDYIIELNTYTEYTTLWTQLLQASREGFKIYIEDEKNNFYDIIENGKVLLSCCPVQPSQ